MGIIEPHWVRFFGFLLILLSLFLIEISSQLIRSTQVTGKPRIGTWLLRVFGISAGLVCMFTNWTTLSIFDDTPVLKINNIGISIIIFHFILNLVILYHVETAFRTFSTHQKRTGRLCLISLGAIAGFQLIFLTNTLLFRELASNYILALIITYGISFPILVLGLFRYRIGNEKVAVSRDIIYSSITLFIAGAILLGLGLTAYIIQRFGIEFTQFELFLGIFSASFLIILLLTSPEMRNRIIHFASRHIYQRKYDYRDQFFRLHQSYMTARNMQESIMQLIINLKYGATFEDAYIFLFNPDDGNFHLQENPISPINKAYTISGSSEITAIFKSNSKPIEFDDIKGPQINFSSQEKEIVSFLKLTAIFPIIHNNNLLGLLGICLASTEQLDKEDKMLIRVFAGSIGNVIYKYQLQREQIENKQFESFSRISSFIIHDVKNQVATLSLLAKNANRNIENPDFQKSLLTSVKNCAANLQVLIDKLGSVPKQEELSIIEQPITPIIRDVIESSGIDTVLELKLIVELNENLHGSIDKNSLFYILKNLIINSLDAMNNRGTLSINANTLDSIPKPIKDSVNIGKHYIEQHKNFISVQDSGCGMSEIFIKDKLFHPFSSTKDKGVGIGLYQCKTLVEKMNGKLLCYSQEGKGSIFIILL